MDNQQFIAASQACRYKSLRKISALRPESCPKSSRPGLVIKPQPRFLRNIIVLLPTKPPGSLSFNLCVLCVFVGNFSKTLRGQTKRYTTATTQKKFCRPAKRNFFFRTANQRAGTFHSSLVFIWSRRPGQNNLAETVCRLV
jgi:hypothetical protein